MASATSVTLACDHLPAHLTSTGFSDKRAHVYTRSGSCLLAGALRPVVRRAALGALLAVAWLGGPEGWVPVETREVRWVPVWKQGRYGQPADCPRLSRALGNPRQELARTGASGAPTGRVRAALVSTRKVLVEAAAHLAALLQLRPRAEPQPTRLALGRRPGMGHVHTIEQRGSRRHLGVAPRRGGRPQ